MFWLARLLATLILTVPQQNLAPFHSTPADVVDRMLDLASVDGTDVVLDLGCGDGRIPIRAAQKYGARSICVEIDQKLVDLARANVKKAGVEQRVTCRAEDAMTTDLSQATVVTLFLLPESNAKLRPILAKGLRPGSRIVSHAFSMGPDWLADKVETFTSANGDRVTLYLWVVR
jgi:predicted O-methyltransferase YrrM